MKTMKSLKTVSILLGIVAMVSSCKKESFEGVEPSPSPATTQVIDQQTDQGEPGNGERESGCVLLSPAAYNKIPTAPEVPSVQTLPVKFYLTCPGIRNQGGEGSCVAFGTAYAARSIKERNSTGGSFSTSVNIFSPEYVYNQIKLGSDCSEGAYITDALDLMMHNPLLSVGKGVCTWAMMPYSSTNGCSTMPSSAQRTDAANHTFLLYGRLTSITASNIKNQLYAGNPVIVGGDIDDNFRNLGSQVYSSYNGVNSEGHCYCIVGWNANKQAFKVMNSWGTNWGDNGFGWIHYGLVSTMFKEAYVIY